MTAPVTPARVAIAAQTLANADIAAIVCREVGLPYFASCALLEKESGGRNIWGGDRGSVTEHLHGKSVTQMAFLQFLVQVMNGGVSNGVGPTQITYAGALDHGHRDGGYFRVMLEQGLRPWHAADNMRFGFGILKGHYDATGSWADAGTRYNGSPVYGDEFAALVQEWKKRLGI